MGTPHGYDPVVSAPPPNFQDSPMKLIILPSLNRTNFPAVVLIPKSGCAYLWSPKDKVLLPLSGSECIPSAIYQITSKQLSYFDPYVAAAENIMLNIMSGSTSYATEHNHLKGAFRKVKSSGKPAEFKLMTLHRKPDLGPNPDNRDRLKDAKMQGVEYASKTPTQARANTQVRLNQLTHSLAR